MYTSKTLANLVRRFLHERIRISLFAQGLVLAFVLSAAGCRSTSTPTNEDCTSKYGLNRSHEYDDIIERGVLFADIVLNNNVRERVQFTEHHAYWYPRLSLTTGVASNPVHVDFLGSDEDPEIRFTNSSPVPVSVIAAGQLSDAENSFVPQGEHCVFINSKTMGTLFGEFALGAGRDPRQFSSFEQALMVSIILLHELGHIHYRDEDPASPNNKDAKGAMLSSTEKEIRADRFAMGQIRKAWKSGDEIKVPGIGTSRWALANHMERVILSASNFHDLRTDPWGVLGHRPNLEIFHQTGYSHLNIFLRIHIMAYQIEGTTYEHDTLRQVVGDAIDTKFSVPEM
jgi:hypothetical protein